jgi:hypothetical protein
MNNLSDDLNMLVGHYGLAAVHSTLETRIKEEYEYLKKLFEKKSDVEQKPVKEKKVEPVVVKNEVVETVEPVVVETVETEVVETVETEKTE